MANSVASWLKLRKTQLGQLWQTAADWAYGVLTNRNNYLLILFLAYLLLIPCFALLYSVLYRGDRRRFAFNQDIARA